MALYQRSCSVQQNLENENKVCVLYMGGLSFAVEILEATWVPKWESLDKI